MKRIGIYSGSFNPVHAGHISFALQAIKAADLDQVFLMPERYRRQKTDLAHFAHRVAMIKQAIKPHSQLSLLETNEINHSAERTLPMLKQRFPGSTLVVLVGSDLLNRIGDWPHAELLLQSTELVVGVRTGDEKSVPERLGDLPAKPKAVTVINSYAPSVSSTKIREALRCRRPAEGVLASVQRYSDRNWLYISLI